MIPNEKKKQMKITTINIGQNVIDTVDTLVDFGFYPSRSEVIRQAVQLLLMFNMPLIKNINRLLSNKGNLQKIIESVREKLPRKKQKNLKWINIPELVGEEVIDGVRIREYRRSDAYMLDIKKPPTREDDIPSDIITKISEINQSYTK